MEYAWTLPEENGDETSRNEPRLRTGQGRNDFVGGIDNEALDFSQLEDFINNENENGNTYFVDTLDQTDGNRHQQTGTTVLVVQTQPEEDIHPHRESRFSLQSASVIASGAPYASTHNLPESPPDSGSEQPYSPQQDGQGKHSPNQKHQEILLHSTHAALFPHVSLKPSGVHPVPASRVTCEPMLIQHSVLTPLLTASSTILNSNNGSRGDSLLLNRDVSNPNLISPSRDGTLLSRNETAILLNADSQLLSSDRILSGDGQISNKSAVLTNTNSLALATGADVLNSALGNSVLLNQPSQPQSQSPSLPPTNAGRSSGSLPPNTESSMTNIYSTLHGGTKKRKLSQDLSNSGSGPILYVKQEKLESNNELSPDSNSNPSGILDEEYNADGNGYTDSSYQCIRFQAFQQPQWHVLCDQNLKELSVPHYRVDADKGFNFSNADDAFVCQKKNHFQITCHSQLVGEAQFVKTPEGLKKITSFYLHFYGVKVESPTQTIKVEQSQSDRSKKPFHPVLVELQNEQVTKVTVGRLHFSETTSNNMRKKGKPNPDQRYFYLVVGLHAHTCDNNYPIVAHASERIIVRASNPGQFESDVELCWQKGHTSESIYHAGKVGINTDRPDESLVVHGNLKVTGHIVQPSDIRAKFKVEECNTKQQLRNIEQIRIVKYRYATEFAEEVGIKEDTGVIAQEIQKILPDAVQPGGDVVLPNGEIIENFLVVNKERIFMENVGAVKELCKVTDHLGKRIERVEKMNRRLAKMKYLEGFKFTSSTSAVYSTAASAKVADKKEEKEKKNGFKNYFFCSNKVIQMTIAFIVFMLTLCLVAMATLYFLEIQRKATITSPLEFYCATTWHNARSNYKLQVKSFGDVNKTFFPQFHKEYYSKDGNMVTKLTSLQSYGKDLFHEPKIGNSPEKRKVQTWLTPAKNTRVLGKPPDCENPDSRNLYNDGNSVVCQVYCCPLENSHSGEERSGQSNFDAPREVESSTVFQELRTTGGSEISQPTGTNEKKKINLSKEMLVRSKQVKKALKRNEKKSEENLSSRRKRDADDINDENNGWDSKEKEKEKEISVRILAQSLNESLGPEFCGLTNDDYARCLDGNPFNSTYYIRLSKYMSDDFIAVHFQLGDNTAVTSCQSVIPQSDFSCRKRPSPSPDPADATNIFYIDIANYWAVFAKYRVPLNQTRQYKDLCSLDHGLGFLFLEYNIHFFRDCQE